MRSVNLGNSLGLTSVPGLTGGGPAGLDFDAASLNANYSSGRFFIDPLTFASITITDVVNPFGGGGAAFRVDVVTPTPEPSTLALFGIGLLGLLAGRCVLRSKPSSSVIPGSVLDLEIKVE